MTVLFSGEINRKTVKTEAVRSVTPPLKPPSLPLIQYKTYLQSYYEKDTIAQDDKLGIAPSSEFINLALVRHDGSTYRHGASFSGSTEGVSEESLGLDSIVTPDSRFVLVEGDAGIGKSTLCWELCRKWDDLKSLQHYKIVLLQKLREIRLQKATTLNEIFHHDNPALSKGVVDEMYRCEGEGVLLVLDGFDEMPDQLIRDESLIMRVISGACLPKATRLVTSRPSAIGHCKGHVFPQVYRHIRTRGFTDKSIEQFAEKAFARNREVFEHFKKFILSNPIIKSMMYIPLNCAILAQVYKDIMKSTMPMPKTMTQLYTTLVLVLIRRRMIERGEWDKDRRVPDDLNGLPGEVTSALKRISELAYRGLFKKIFQVQLVFLDDEVGEDFEHLGLLSEAKDMYVSKGARSTYSFSHKSIQEFLAACCVAHHSDMIGEPAAHEKPHTPLIHEAFSLFLCGMVGCNARLLEQCGGAYICRCLYEAQDHNNSLFLSDRCEIACTLTTPLDAYTLGYCLTHLHLQFQLDCIHTSLKPLLSSLHNYTGTLSGSIKRLPMNDSLRSITLRDQFKSLIEIFNSKGRPIIGIDIYTAGDDLEWLSEFIPTLHLTTHLSFGIVEKFDLLKRCTKRCAQNLCNVISSVNLKEVTLKSYEEHLFDTGIGIDEQVLSDSFSVIEPFVSIVEAVMSSPTINKLTTNFAFQVFKNRYIQDIVFDVKYECYDTADTCSSALSIRRILMSLWYCIEKVHESGFILPPKSVTLRIHGVVDCIICNAMERIRYRHQYPMYNFLAIVNKYLLQCCKYNRTQLIVEDISCCESSLTEYPICCTLNELGRALRREPYLSSCALKKTQSLGDLRTSPSLVEFKPMSGNNSQSCPDLLELEALTNLHPKLREFAGILEPSQLNLDDRHHSSYIYRLVLPFPPFLIRPCQCPPSMVRISILL